MPRSSYLNRAAGAGGKALSELEKACKNIAEGAAARVSASKLQKQSESSEAGDIADSPRAC